MAERGILGSASPGRSTPPGRRSRSSCRRWSCSSIGCRRSIFAYHVRAGASIVSGAGIPRSDTWTFTVPGGPWVDQQWLAQVIFDLVHGAGGWSLIWLFRALLGSTAFGLLYLACRARGVTMKVASLLTLAGFTAAYFNLGMRPQMLAVPTFCAVLWSVASRRGHPGRLVLLPLAAVFLANVHGSFPLVLVVGVLATLEDAIDRDPGWRRTAVMTSIAVGATFISPFGPQVWSYVATIATNDQIRTTITEWRPLDATTPTGGLVVAGLLGALVFLARQDTPTPWRTLVWLAVFAVPALLSGRSALWLALIGPLVLADQIGPSEATSRRPGESALPARVIIGSLLAATVIALPWFRSTPDEAMLDDAPAGLTSAVRTEVPPGARVLIHQPWASWFEYATPSILPFADSRIEIFPDAVWDDYAEVAFAGAGWAEALERWDVEAIIASEDWVSSRSSSTTQDGGSSTRTTREPCWCAPDAYSAPTLTKPDRAALRIAAIRVPTPSLP